MLDALCGIVAKINKRKNNDLTQGRLICSIALYVIYHKHVMATKMNTTIGLWKWINMGEKHTDNKFGNGLFEVADSVNFVYG